MEVKILVVFMAKIVLLGPFMLLTVAAVNWPGKHVVD